jgi:hypothetical protein
MKISDEHHTLASLSQGKATGAKYNLEQPGTTVYSVNNILSLEVFCN